MSAPSLETLGYDRVTLGRSPSFWDSDSESTIVFAHPAIERELWADYVQGACHNYRQHRVEAALDMAALRTGNDTALFVTAVNSAGRVVGGVRVKGPYRSADECHAVGEWNGQPGRAAVHKMVADRLPFGVAELKTAWVGDDHERGRQITNAIARVPLHTMDLLDVQFCVATAGSYVLKRWLSSGGVLAAKIPATPYPDERYQTRLAWWDRWTYANNTEPKQLVAFFAEQKSLVPRVDEAGEIAVGIM